MHSGGIGAVQRLADSVHHDLERHGKQADLHGPGDPGVGHASGQASRHTVSTSANGIGAAACPSDAAQYGCSCWKGQILATLITANRWHDQRHHRHGHHADRRPPPLGQPTSKAASAANGSTSVKVMATAIGNGVASRSPAPLGQAALPGGFMRRR